MVDLARQAFSTNNFDLAADIYARNITENGPSVENYIGLADSLAKGGQFKKAFEAYSKAYRLGKVQPESLGNLVTALIEMLKTKEDPMITLATSAKPASAEELFSGLFSCDLCKGVWDEPITVACGHTFCRKCLEKTDTKNCKKCGAVLHIDRLSHLKTNVLLTSITERWYPNKAKAGRLRSEGNLHFKKKDYRQAIKVYSEAFEYAPTDHILVSNRSHAYAAVGLYMEALSDADEAVQLCPHWPKGYFRRGTALSALDRNEEAVLAFLQCLTLDPMLQPAKSSLANALHKILLPISVEDSLSKHLDTPLPYGSSALGRTFRGMPTLSLLNLEHLKEDISESLLTRRNIQPVPKLAVTPQGATSVSLPSLHTEHLKCSSAPVSRQSSPIPLVKRAQSAMSVLFIEADNKVLSRKRSCEDSPTETDVVAKKLGCKCCRADELGIAKESIRVEDFECSLCYRLLYDPVTTPCGHIFCRHCLDRCLDHSSNCPLCKSTLAEYLAERRQAITEALEQIIEMLFPTELEERKKLHEADLALLASIGDENQAEIPVFVCTLAYPKVACPLHIFEPRYRLMIRQCMETGIRQFGMCACLGDNEDNFADYGCMLEVRDVQYMPDGRSVVDTVGGRRFRVKSRGHRDGYHTAAVEYLQDNMPSQEAEMQELLTLHNSVHTEAKEWIDNLPAGPKARISSHFGQFPELEPDILTLTNGPTWSWWILAILPLDPRAQLSVLAMTSLKERLIAIRRVLAYVKRQSSH